MIDIDTTFRHDFLQITVGNTIAHVKKHRIKNRFFGEMTAAERNHGTLTCWSKTHMRMQKSHQKSNQH